MKGGGVGGGGLVFNKWGRVVEVLFRPLFF